MKMKKTISGTSSPRLSFKGYSLPLALYRNKDAIKAIIAIIAAINVVGPVDTRKFLLQLAVAGFGLGIKLLQDLVDFYFTEVEL